MDFYPDVLTIGVEHQEDLSADRAELLLTVQGSSLVTGRAALTKAREVAVTAAKNARLDDIQWRYPDSHARQRSANPRPRS